MQVKQSYVIEELVVEKVASFHGMEVYSNENDENTTTLFFCKKGKVIQRLVIMADCNQNEGFISNLSFIDVH